MKKLLAISFGMISLGIVGCGGGGNSETVCAESLILGSYQLNNGSTLTFREDCSWTSDTCDYTASIPNITKSSGTVTVSISSSPIGPAGGCLATGSHTCNYIVGEEFLSYDCSGN